MPELMHEGSRFHRHALTVDAPETQAYKRICSAQIGNAGSAPNNTGCNRKKGIGVRGPRRRRACDLYRETRRSGNALDKISVVQIWVGDGVGNGDATVRETRVGRIRRKAVRI